MIKSEKQENKGILEDSINYLEQKGFENIKADIPGYETPRTFLRKKSDVKITPDIVADRAGIRHYFDLSLKSEKPQLLKSKWRFLEVFTRMKDYRFKIITRKGHYKFTNEMLSDLNLKKNLIKI
ncbi:MAG: hypothetical protein HKN48_07605 [Flavobacteriaceae bacterium]|nr:hypothetical protein [Flavobacteriaceae bacterium]